MVFAYDSELSLQAATELVNTAAEPDTLTTVADLDDFLSRYRFTGRHERTGPSWRRSATSGPGCARCCWPSATTPWAWSTRSSRR